MADSSEICFHLPGERDVLAEFQTRPRRMRFGVFRFINTSFSLKKRLNDFYDITKTNLRMCFHVKQSQKTQSGRNMDHSLNYCPFRGYCVEQSKKSCSSVHDYIHPSIHPSRNEHRAPIGTTFWNICEGPVKFNCSKTDHL